MKQFNDKKKDLDTHFSAFALFTTNRAIIFHHMTKKLNKYYKEQRPVWRTVPFRKVICIKHLTIA